MKLQSCQCGDEVPQQAIYIHGKINVDVPEKKRKKIKQDLECKCDEVSPLMV